MHRVWSGARTWTCRHVRSATVVLCAAFLGAAAPAALPTKPVQDLTSESPSETTLPVHLAAVGQDLVRLHDLSLVEGDVVPAQSWTHPLSGPVRHMPRTRTRIFGAKRDRVARPECGQGHCGVDLGGPIGLTIHNVRDGVVTRIIHSTDRISGKYVRVSHRGDIASYYMHLDAIAEDIYVGAYVPAGAVLGTLGDSGIRESLPHLHFQISRRIQGRETYVDPEPMLAKARLLPGDEAHLALGGQR